MSFTTVKKEYRDRLFRIRTRTFTCRRFRFFDRDFINYRVLKDETHPLGRVGYIIYVFVPSKFPPQRVTAIRIWRPLLLLLLLLLEHGDVAHGVGGGVVELVLDGAPAPGTALLAVHHGHAHTLAGFVVAKPGICKEIVGLAFFLMMYLWLG